jgi:hypothetical protein
MAGLSAASCFWGKQRKGNQRQSSAVQTQRDIGESTDIFADFCQLVPVVFVALFLLFCLKVRSDGHSQCDNPSPEHRKAVSEAQPP